MNIQIHKFGGAALGKKEGILSLQNLIFNDTNPKVIVISALENTTRLLKSISFAAEKNDIPTAENLLKNLIDKHIDKISIFNIAHTEPAKDEILKIGEHLDKLIKGIAFTNQLTDRTLDLMMSFGEKLAITLLKYKFMEFSDIEFLDSTEFIRTNSHYGNATPDNEVSKKMVEQNLLPKFEQKHTIITQGFVGKDSLNEITTMGLESSNLTATLLADFLQCKILTIWTDVDGIKSADPNRFQNVTNIDFLDYTTAELASYSGLKLIYPTMIDIARKKGIEIVFKSALTQNSSATRISDFNEKHQPLFILDEGIIEITEKKNILERVKFKAKDFIYIKIFANEIKFYQKINNKILQKNQRIVDILSLLSIQNKEKEILDLAIKYNIEILEYSNHNLKLIVFDNKEFIDEMYKIINGL